MTVLGSPGLEPCFWAKTVYVCWGWGALLCSVIWLSSPAPLPSDPPRLANAAREKPQQPALGKFLSSQRHLGFQEPEIGLSEYEGEGVSVTTRREGGSPSQSPSWQGVEV